MRTQHYGELPPLVTAFEITDDFGNLMVFEDHRAPVSVWVHATEFLASGLEIA
jgi:hypothetical protein